MTRSPARQRVAVEVAEQHGGVATRTLLIDGVKVHRLAATVAAMTMRQRLAHPAGVLAAWDGAGRCARREILTEVLADVCDGAHSLD